MPDCKLTESLAFKTSGFSVLRGAPRGILQRFQKVGESVEEAVASPRYATSMDATTSRET